MAAIWRIGAGLALAWLCCGFSGCAATMAMHQPDKKDLSVLQPGVPRSRVVAELGPPLTSYPSDAGGVDVFTFKQGYTRVNRTARALGHATGTVVTGGIWEIAGIPLETWNSGTEVKLEVAYDVYGAVAAVHVFEGAEAFRGHVLASHVHLAGAGPPMYSPPPAFTAPTPLAGTSTTTASPVSGPPGSNVSTEDVRPTFDPQPEIDATALNKASSE